MKEKYKDKSQWPRLVCLVCGGELISKIIKHEGYYNCNNCKRRYPIVDDVGILIDRYDVNKETQERIFSQLVSALNEDYSASFLNYPITIQDTKKARFLELLELHENDMVLDIGCYAGGFARFLSKTYKTKVVGVDISPSCIKYCLKCNRYENRFYVADAESLPFAEQSFDAVLCIALLEHLSDIEKGISEIYRILKSGGKAIIQLPVRDYKYTLLWVLNKIMPQKLEKRLGRIGHDYHRLLTSQELLGLLQAKGFMIRKSERVGSFVQPLHDWFVIPFLYQKIFKQIKNIARNISWKKHYGSDDSRVKTDIFSRYKYGESSPFRKAYSKLILPAVKILVSLEKLIGLRSGYCIYILAMKGTYGTK